MKKYFLKFSFCLISILLFLSNFAFSQVLQTYADTYGEGNEIYLVYNENNQVIFESNKVEVGDKILTCNLEEYEITNVDETRHEAYAEFNGYYEMPKINKKSKDLNLSNKQISKSVGLYLSHNDESYVPTDNTSSIYGKGGIHDVASSLAEEFKKLNYNVYLDETLHLPHDKNAYTRSSVTATNLKNKNVDALFDIHRDGVSRSVYVKNVDGVERCKVRIVVGLANPNKDANLQFAMYLVSVAKEYCPWLFLDIYQAKGHYNQALTSKGLLFEMGTYLAEKELALDTTKYLAKVVDKTLFSTVVEEEDNTITVTDTPPTLQEGNLVNNVLNNKMPQNNFKSKYTTNLIVFGVIFTLITIGIVTYAVIKHKKRLKLATQKVTKSTTKKNKK